MKYVQPIRDKHKIEEIKSILKQNGTRDLLLFSMGINTGLRISDLLKLRVIDVRGKSHVEIKEQKTNKFKKFPINDKLKKLIQEFIKDKEDDEPLFLSQKQKRLDRSQAYRMLNEACEAVGITVNIGTHSMRKSFGYHHYKQFKDVAMLQMIFNHSNPKITLRYIGIEQDEIDNSYKQFVL